MPIHQRIIGQILTRGGKYVAKSVYSTLRIQDRIIDKTYRKTGLYNRGVVRGIQHGLVSGQIVGGTLNLGLPSDIENGFQKGQRNKTGSKYKKRFRVQRYYGRGNKYCRPKYSRRR